MEESFLKERNIYYRTNNFTSDKLTLIFIHGMSGSSSAWWKYENKFKEKYNILTYDLRGHGKSHRYTKYNDYKIEKFSEDLYELVKNLNIKKFIIISHSYGTFVSLDFISKHEEYIMASIFLSPHFNITKMSSAKILKPFIDAISKVKFPIYTNKARKHIDYSKYLNTGDLNIRRSIADVSNTGLQVYLMCTKQSYSFDYENLLEKIKVPVLIISGKKDTIFPNEYAHAMAQKIPNAKIVTIEGTDHIIVLNNFKEVSEVIDNFVKNLI